MEQQVVGGTLVLMFQVGAKTFVCWLQKMGDRDGPTTELNVFFPRRNLPALNVWRKGITGFYQNQHTCTTARAACCLFICIFQASSFIFFLVSLFCKHARPILFQHKKRLQASGISEIRYRAHGRVFFAVVALVLAAIQIPSFALCRFTG